jgi:hypothetical protein
MVLQILLRHIHLGSFLLVATKRIILAIFVSAATFSTMIIRTLDSPAMSTKLFGYFSLSYWCWYSCRCWLTILMAARVYVALALRFKLKLWENHRWYLQVYGLVSILAAFRKVQDYVMEEERVWRHRRFASFFKKLFYGLWFDINLWPYLTRSFYYH